MVWGLQHSGNRPKGREVEELLSHWILEAPKSKLITFRWADGKVSMGDTINYAGMKQADGQCSRVVLGMQTPIVWG